MLSLNLLLIAYSMIEFEVRASADMILLILQLSHRINLMYGSTACADCDDDSVLFHYSTRLFGLEGDRRGSRRSFWRR